MELPISDERKEVRKRLMRASSQFLRLGRRTPSFLHLTVMLTSSQRRSSAWLTWWRRTRGSVPPAGGSIRRAPGTCRGIKPLSMLWVSLEQNCHTSHFAFWQVGHWLQKATEHILGCVLCRLDPDQLWLDFDQQRKGEKNQLNSFKNPPPKPALAVSLSSAGRRSWMTMSCGDTQRCWGMIQFSFYPYIYRFQSNPLSMFSTTRVRTGIKN